MSDKKRTRPSTSGDSPPARSAAAASPMNVALLEQIVKLMAVNDLNTVDVRDGDQRIILKRGATVVTPPMTYNAASPPPVMPAPLSSGQGAGPAPSATEESGLVAIKAEMVGTFYASSKPGEKSFVSVGSTVDDETQICLIEAMKNFFPVKAGVRGTVARIMAQDGQTVQFDQVMFMIKPS